MRLPWDLPTLEALLKARLPERHLLDILKHVHYWIGYTRHFGPLSGTEPKLSSPVLRYIFTVFGYACELGPSQTARHTTGPISRQILRRLNAQHITTAKLEAAVRDVIAEYARFELPFLWGSGQAAIADGTHIALLENNLLGAHHVRYGRFGGIAYHHISDTYIALFSHFIACGVWEAVYILDGLLKNLSALQPHTLFADTHGQAEPVFGLAALLGITLMPRMRTWNDVTFYRVDHSTTYQHIDRLLTQVVDGNLIERYWQDMLQVVLSIQAGKVLPSMLLQRLGVYSRQNTLYKAFSEVGRVERTIFLLEYMANTAMRQHIRAETTKVEAYHQFTDWIAFGGPVLRSADPVEQEKRIKEEIEQFRKLEDVERPRLEEAALQRTEAQARFQYRRDRARAEEETRARTEEPLNVKEALPRPSASEESTNLDTPEVTEHTFENPEPAWSRPINEEKEKGAIPVEVESNPGATAAIHTYLNSVDPYKRAAAVAELARSNSTDAFDLIAKCFDDHSPQVRNAAARALRKLEPNRTVDLFNRALEEGSEERRRNIGAAIADSGLAAEAIDNLVGDSREDTYNALLILFAMAKTGEVQPLVQAIENHENVEVCRAVIKLLTLNGQTKLGDAALQRRVTGVSAARRMANGLDQPGPVKDGQ